MAEGQQVQTACSKTDRYGRDVCRVLLRGSDVGLEQIRRGLAWHFKRYAHEQTTTDRSVYADAESEARDEKRGLWFDPSPEPPWLYRSTQRKQNQRQNLRER